MGDSNTWVPTPHLRFVDRSHCVDREFQTPESKNILQQLWVQQEWAHDMTIIVNEEWRDVPTEEEE